MVSTGEIRPSGKSLNARVLNIEINPGDILGDSDHKKSEQLAAAQENARNGVYARVTTAFIEWLAPQLEIRRGQLHKISNDFRRSFWDSCNHARLANTAGELLAAFHIFMEFAEENGCGFEGGFEGAFEDAFEALVEVLKDQELAQLEEDPVDRFLGAIVTALTTGKAHVLSRYGLKIQDEVKFPKVWGYEEKVVRTQVESSATTVSESDEDTDQHSQTDDDSDEPQVVEFQEHTYFVPKGDCIGWISNENIYFEPNAAVAIAQRLMVDTKQPPIPLSPKTLGKRLAERHLLVSTTKGRNTQRITIEGAKRNLFHIMAFNLFDYYDSENVDDVYGEEVTESSQESLRQKQAWQADRLQRNQEARRKRDDDFLEMLA